jgi:probable HAF family extracellular repeat protein
MQSLNVSAGAFFSEGLAISADGSTVVGDQIFPAGTRACRWTAATGMVDLGMPLTGTTSFAHAASGDGGVIAGMANAFASDMFRWTAGAGMVALGGGAAWPGYAHGISPDGTVIVGQMGQGRAFRWTSAAGFTDLGTLPGDASASAYAISTSGTVVGYSSGPQGNRAFKWTSTGGMVNLGAPPGQSTVARAVSADGSVVVGSGPNGPWFWTSALGRMDLVPYLTDLGLDLSGWILSEATGVSADGLTIVGNGIHGVQDPFPIYEGWVAVLGPRCYPNCDDSTAPPVLNVTDFTCFLNRFAAGSPYANCDHSTAAPTLNVLDFVCFLNQFAAGCP